MSRTPSLAPPIARASQTNRSLWTVSLLLLATCTSDGPESEAPERRLTKRILKPAPASEVATWQRVTSTVSPEGRFLQALAFDETRDLVLMFGGHTRSLMSGMAQPLQDMWEWSTDTGLWTLRRTSGPVPTARAGAAMVYDPVRKKVLLFGGRAASGYDYEDLWEWDPSTGGWTDRSVSGNHPAARAQHAMLYQTSTNKILLFGGGRSSTGSDGIGVSASFGDTWELDPATATWTALTPAQSPTMRHDFGLVWDSARNKAVLFGGLQIDIPGATGVPKQDTWEWDPGTHTWTERTSAGSKPSQRFALAMAYDDRRSRVVLFGGSDMLTGNSKNDMWEWDASTFAWSQVRTGIETGMPGVRSYASMIYNHAHALLELVAGLVTYSDPSIGYQGQVPSNQVWEIDPAALTFGNRTIAYQGPVGRGDHAMAYNPSTGRTYVFGGIDMSKKGTTLTDLWEWDGSTWTEVVAEGGPEARIDAAIAYDPVRQSLILFGGNNWNGTTIGNDTWEWSGKTRQWSRLSVVGSPEARWGHGMVTDTARGKILMYGGSGKSASLGSEVWEWDGASATWTNRNAQSFEKNPKGRTYPVMSFDDARGKLVLYDGLQDLLLEGESTSSYWEWDVISGGWTLHAPGDTLASATYAYAAYDSTRRRHVFFTNASVNSILQTWELDANTETWYVRMLDVTPGSRNRSGMVFDSARRVAVLFGGNLNTSPGGPANDTWEYSVKNLANGEGCTSATAASCASGQCVDGVCCETAGCTGACMACNVRGSEGLCVRVKAGTEIAGSCSNGQACDGTGACKSKNGQTCTAGSGCASGFCVDGVCCDGACTGECKSCNLAGHIGTCTPQAAGSDPDSECGLGTGSCKSRCDGVGACAFPFGLGCGNCLTCDGAGACTRADPGCGGSGGSGGKDSSSSKPPLSSSGGSGGSVKSSGGAGASGGMGGGGAVSSSSSKGGASSSASNGGSSAGAVSSSSLAGAGGGGSVSSQTSNGGGVSSSAGTMGGSSSASSNTGGAGGIGATTSSAWPRDAGSQEANGTAQDGGAPRGDAATDARLVGRLGSRGCGCDLGQSNTSPAASLMWTLLAGVGVFAVRPRRRRP